ncbi:unnamed protein product [Gadus morhua 'NCC']
MWIRGEADGKGGGSGVNNTPGEERLTACGQEHSWPQPWSSAAPSCLVHVEFAPWGKGTFPPVTERVRPRPLRPLSRLREPAQAVARTVDTWKPD